MITKNNFDNIKSKNTLKDYQNKNLSENYTNISNLPLDNMIINSNLQTLVVGFLCEYNDSINLSEKTWVKITGEIQKGNYNGEIPIIIINSLEKIDKPTDEYVYPPDNAYLQTSVLL